MGSEKGNKNRSFDVGRLIEDDEQCSHPNMVTIIRTRHVLGILCKLSIKSRSNKTPLRVSCEPLSNETGAEGKIFRIHI